MNTNDDEDDKSTLGSIPESVSEHPSIESGFCCAYQRRTFTFTSMHTHTHTDTEYYALTHVITETISFCNVIWDDQWHKHTHTLLEHLHWINGHQSIKADKSINWQNQIVDKYSISTLCSSFCLSFKLKNPHHQHHHLSHRANIVPQCVCTNWLRINWSPFTSSFFSVFSSIEFIKFQ